MGQKVPSEGLKEVAKGKDWKARPEGSKEVVKGKDWKARQEGSKVVAKGKVTGSDGMVNNRTVQGPKGPITLTNRG